MTKRPARHLVVAAIVGFFPGLSSSIVAPLKAEELSASPFGTDFESPKLAQSTSAPEKLEVQSSTLASENNYLRAELEEATGKIEALQTEIKQLQEKTSVDPFLAGVYPVDTELGLKLAQIHFDTGSAELTPGASRRILAVADWITKAGIEEVTLVGLSDSRGSPDQNLQLSMARAASVADLLEKHGMSRDVIKLDARGEGFQIEETPDGVSEPLNRCVGIFVDGDKAKGKVSLAE